jgi:rSAM/selenodomain-associated transferase 1
MTNIVHIFAKAPQAGQVKTRLMPHYDAAAAAAIYRQLLWSQLTRLAGQFRLQLWCAPSPQHPFLQQCAQQFAATLHTQHGADLGQRMAYALASTAPLPSVLIGSDCPTLDSALVQAAFRHLQQQAAVFAPTEDGGYCLVGMHKVPPGFFLDMAWSQTTVMAETRQRLQALGLTWAELPTQWDVDRPEDVARWAAMLKSA